MAFFTTLSFCPPPISEREVYDILTQEYNHSQTVDLTVEEVSSLGRVGNVLILPLPIPYTPRKVASCPSPEGLDVGQGGWKGKGSAAVLQHLAFLSQNSFRKNSFCKQSGKCFIFFSPLLFRILSDSRPCLNLFLAPQDLGLFTFAFLLS